MRCGWQNLELALARPPLVDVPRATGLTRNPRRCELTALPPRENRLTSEKPGAISARRAFLVSSARCQSTARMRSAIVPIRPSTPLTNRGESSVDSSLASPTASSIATGSGTSAAHSSS